MKRNAKGRKLYGVTSADQQLERQFKAHQAKVERIERLGEKLYELKAERDGLKTALAEDGAAKYTGLLGKREFGLDYIPLQKAKDLTGKSSFRVSTVQRGAHKYVPAEWFFDQLSAEAGYADDRALKDGIEKAIDSKRKVAKLGTEIAELTAELKRATAERRAKVKTEKARARKRAA